MLFALEDSPQWSFAGLHGRPSDNVLTVILQSFVYFYKSLILEVPELEGTSGWAVHELAARSFRIP